MDYNYSFFIDESCHLEHDGFPAMCIGTIKVPDNKILQYKKEIKNIKRKYGILHEIKWNTISHTHIKMYKEIIDFFMSSEMNFRCVLVTYKNRLDNASFNNGSHDNFYYKMVYYVLHNPYVNDYSKSKYRVFLDIKDTNGRAKLDKIQQVFQSIFHGSSPFVAFQNIRSHESQFIQLVDLFIGAITYKARNLQTNSAKLELIKYLECKTGYTINEGTEPSESKFNIFNHQPRLYARD